MSETVHIYPETVITTLPSKAVLVETVRHSVDIEQHLAELARTPFPDAVREYIHTLPKLTAGTLGTGATYILVSMYDRYISPTNIRGFVCIVVPSLISDVEEDVNGAYDRFRDRVIEVGDEQSPQYMQALNASERQVAEVLAYAERRVEEHMLRIYEF